MEEALIYKYSRKKMIKEDAQKTPIPEVMPVVGKTMRQILAEVEGRGTVALIPE